MTAWTWTHTHPGTPRPQGSMRMVVSRSTGRPIGKKSNSELQHRASLVSTLWAAWRWGPTRGRIWTGPVSLSLTFTMPRPKSHRPGPVLHAQRPDVDKLTRLVCDALTLAKVYNDDSQVTVLTAEKRWGPAGMTAITVAGITTTEEGAVA